VQTTDTYRNESDHDILIRQCQDLEWIRKDLSDIKFGLGKKVDLDHLLDVKTNLGKKADVDHVADIKALLAKKADEVNRRLDEMEQSQDRRIEKIEQMQEAHGRDIAKGNSILKTLAAMLGLASAVMTIVYQLSHLK
jgi:hypothetical protein